MTIHVAIHVFDQMEVLDFAGPYEVFTTAARVHGRAHAGEPPFRVFTVAGQAGAVTARAGLRVLPDHVFGDGHPPPDVLIVPGGAVDAELGRPEVLAWIAAQARRVRLLASVCTGAFLLAEAGCVDGLEVTTHWEDAADLRARYPALRVTEGVRWVDRGPVVTSAGISAGIDMALHLVERLHSRDLALRTARQMDFDWKEND